MAIIAIWWFEIIIYTAVCLTPANTYPYMYNQCAYFKPIMITGAITDYCAFVTQSCKFFSENSELKYNPRLNVTGFTKTRHNVTRTEIHNIKATL